jgi:serine/threonine protein phosphatase PrpC
MDVAIRGDLASCLTLRLAPSTWVFAVARGFGEVEGMPIARAVLSRFEAECRRRARGEARRKRLQRSPVAAGALCGALLRVNGALYLRSAGSDDYVPSACSLSAALVVGNRAYVAHAGSTAIYLVHDDDTIALTRHDDVFADTDSPVLARALGISPTLTVTVSSVALESGDVLAFCERGEEQVLRVRYEPSDDAPQASDGGFWCAMALRVRAIFHC